MDEPRSPVAAPFRSLEQQHAATTLGMWVFLVTELLLFSGLFLGYTIYRLQYPEAFAHATAHVHVGLGAFNTLVLLTSSLTVALAVHAAQEGDRARTVRNLGFTGVLGLLFLGVKAVEYTLEYRAGMMPILNLGFDYTGLKPDPTELFFNLYYAATGLHAVHVLIGVVCLTLIALGAGRGRFLGPYHLPVELTGLYWHFVDVVWVFLFPLLYLIGR